MTHALPVLRRPATAAALAAALIGLSVPLEAEAQRKVYLNQVDLADVEVKSLKLDNCGVRFDAAGNVHITCKGVDIKTTPTKSPRVDDDPPPAAGGPLSRRYFLVAKPVGKGRAAPFKVSVYINKKQIVLVEPSEDLYVLEVTKHLTAGDNDVRLVAARDIRGDASRSPKDTLELIIGEGVVRDGTVVIQKPLVVYRRNGSETRSFDDSYRMQAR